MTSRIDPRFNQSTKIGIILILTSMAFLTGMQEPVGMSFLAWFSLVPWVLAMSRAKQGRKIVAWSYLGGIGYYLVNLWWLTPLTVAGAVGLCLYLAIYFPLCGFILRGVYRYTRLPFTLVLPIVWVAQEFLRARVMTGFAWFFLSHSQHDHTALLQISDLFGAYGVTFLVAMVNGLICDFLLRPLKSSGEKKSLLAFRPVPCMLLTLGCVIATFVYGGYRIGQGKQMRVLGPLVAVIQDNVPQSLKMASESSINIFNRHLALTQAALAGDIKPDLIVWPETMVSDINREYLNQPPPTDERELYHWQRSHLFNDRLVELAKQGSALLVGSSSIERHESKPDSRFNSAELFLADGSRWPQRYDKMHLVPFGEVVPFRQSWPWMYRLLNSLTPYEYEYTLDAGVEATVFEVPGAGERPYRFGVAICYEDVMPHVPRQLAAVEGNGKRLDFLLNISNEGWYVRPRQDQTIQTTAELPQHLAICQFRAVENRVPIVRSVNMGISAFIDSNGAVQGKGLAGNLPVHAKDRQGVAGFLIDRVYFDPRVTLYSVIGDSFSMGCTFITVLLLMVAGVSTVLARKKDSLAKGLVK